MRKLRATIALLVLMAGSLVLAGCFGIPSEPQVAATVNGEKILESDVTDYIEGFRTQNPEYESDEGWAEFLSGNGFTAESMRRFVLDSVFIPKVIIRQECTMRGIALTDSELDDVIGRERSYYEGRYGEGSWDSVLSSYGYDEESWRENEANRLLEEQLVEEVVGAVQASSREVQEEADRNASVYNGKHSYYLAFESETDAQAALETLRDTEGDMTLERFESVGVRSVDAGWNSLPADRDEMSTEYVSALNELAQGECSGIVAEEGRWVILLCDQVFSVSTVDGHVNLDAMPAQIRAQVEQDAHDAAVDREFSAWMDEETAKSDIQYMEIPDGLPYDVNVAIDRTDDA